MSTIIFGLGAMGMGMAQSLLRGSVPTTGFDINAEPEEKFRALGGGSEARDVAIPQADIAVLVVVNAAQTEDLLFGEAGIASQLKKGAVVISCATLAASKAVELEQRAEALGLLYLDAPISGGAVKAGQGALSVMASGRPEAFAKAKPALDALAQTVFELGDKAGPGSAMKSVNQLLAGVHIAAMAEALNFGLAQGIDAARMVEVISQSAGNSWMFENRGKFVAEGDYRPHSANAIFIKDLGIVADTAQGLDAPTPLTDTALKSYLAARDAGYDREGDISMIKTYAEKAGVALPGVKKD